MYGLQVAKPPILTPKLAQNPAKSRISTRHSPETHRNYDKPHINGFLRVARTFKCCLHIEIS